VILLKALRWIGFLLIALGLALPYLPFDRMGAWLETLPALVGLAGNSPPSPLELASDRVRARIDHRDGLWTIHLTDPAGKPFAAWNVILTLSNPAAPSSPLVREAGYQAGQGWQAALPALSKEGAWSVRLDVQVEDFNEITLQYQPPRTVD
jgi:hypothetical protein